MKPSITTYPKQADVPVHSIVRYRPIVHRYRAAPSHTQISTNDGFAYWRPQLNFKRGKCRSAVDSYLKSKATSNKALLLTIALIIKTKAFFSNVAQQNAPLFRRWPTTGKIINNRSVISEESKYSTSRRPEVINLDEQTCQYHHAADFTINSRHCHAKVK